MIVIQVSTHKHMGMKSLTCWWWINHHQFNASFQLLGSISWLKTSCSQSGDVLAYVAPMITIRYVYSIYYIIFTKFYKCYQITFECFNIIFVCWLSFSIPSFRLRSIIHRLGCDEMLSIPIQVRDGSTLTVVTRALTVVAANMFLHFKP